MQKTIKVKFQSDSMREVACLRVAECDFKGLFRELKGEFHGVEFSVLMRRDDPFLDEFKSQREMVYIKSSSGGVTLEGFLSRTQAMMTFAIRLPDVDEEPMMELITLLHRLEKLDLKDILLKCYAQRSVGVRGRHVLEEMERGLNSRYSDTGTLLSSQSGTKLDPQ